jgi:tetratricopeptide (TPR) repeat protein
MLEELKPRNVVPKWRSSAATVSTNEASFGVYERKVDYGRDIRLARLEFERTPAIPTAAELMFLAADTGENEVSCMAANFILERQTSIFSKSLVAFAKKEVAKHLGETIVVDHPSDSVVASDLRKQSNAFLQKARELLSLDYRNPVLLVDMALELTSAGHHKSALRYVRAAVAMAPSSRFVVRAAARYYLHVGEHELAHLTLRRSPNVKSDPWILASELAVATLRKKPSLLTRQTLRSLLESKQIGPERAELASAVATMELNSGSNKNAKQLFTKSLIHPNDNSLAQAEWAAQRLKLVVDERALGIPLSYEANANHAFRAMQIHKAIEYAGRWAKDEPFASRPFDALSYFYSLEDDYVNALSASERAIRIEDEEKLSLQLNRLFSKIQLGEIEGCAEELMRLAKHKSAKSHAVHLIADFGALAYATRDFDNGRKYYEQAIELARKLHDSQSEAQALAFFARASIAHRDPYSSVILERASKKVPLLSSPGAIYVVSRLVDQRIRQALIATSVARVLKREWSWDSASNILRELG